MELLISSVLCLVGAALMLKGFPWTEPVPWDGRRIAGLIISLAGIAYLFIPVCIGNKPASSAFPAFPEEDKDQLIEKAERLKKWTNDNLPILEEYKKHPQKVPAGHYSLIVEIPDDFNTEMLRELLPLEINNKHVHRVVLEHGKRYDGLDEAYAIGKKEAFQKLGLKAEVIPENAPAELKL